MHPLTFTADDGELLRVWRHGEAGPAIVLLHGWTASHLEWSPFIHDLAACSAGMPAPTAATRRARRRWLPPGEWHATWIR